MNMLTTSKELMWAFWRSNSLSLFVLYFLILCLYFRFCFSYYLLLPVKRLLCRCKCRVIILNLRIRGSLPKFWLPIFNNYFSTCIFTYIMLVVKSSNYIQPRGCFGFVSVLKLNLYYLNTKSHIKQINQ